MLEILCGSRVRWSSPIWLGLGYLGSGTRRAASHDGGRGQGWMYSAQDASRCHMGTVI